ncbi:MAG TPA: DUF4194 domain-containing protein [Propionicimonas sp.]|jgi:hypothetical protein
MNSEEAPDTWALWDGDTGGLVERSRRALVDLVKGPYLARARRRELWEALLADEALIRSRLHDLFLDVVIDRENEIAFVRPIELDSAPEVVRTRSLTFMDTAMLLVLRQTLLAEEGRGRAIIGQDELFDALAVYRKGGRDEADFRKRVNASWANMQTLGLLHPTEEGRAEISPIVRFLVDAERVAAIQGAYDRAVAGDRPDDAGGEEGEPE